MNVSINRPLLLIIAGAGFAAAAALSIPAWRRFHETPPAPPALPTALRLALALGDDLSIGAGPDHPFGLALSPDGRRLAFPATRAGVSQIWVRDVTTGETAALPGTSGGIMPFWSPDGRQMGFFAGGRLKSFSFEHGLTTDLADAPAPAGGAWRTDHEIVFAPGADGSLFRLFVEPFRGLQRLTDLDESAGELSHRFPVRLDARNVLFFVHAANPGQDGISVIRIEPEEIRSGLKRDPVRLTASDAHAIAFADWILYARDGALLAQQISGLESEDRKPSLVGRALLVGTPVGRSPLGQLSATAAADLVVFGESEPAHRQLRWVDREGAPQGTLASDVDAWDVRIAPKGSSIAVTARDAQLGTLDISVYDGTRALPRKISRAIDVDDSPVWSPDATRIGWVTGGHRITVRGAQATIPEQEFNKFDGQLRLWDWTPDGRSLVIGLTTPDTKDDVFIVPVDRAEPLVPYARTPFNERHAAVSPDSSWIAYVSDESGQAEIYVDSFPSPGHRSRVTLTGGTEPRWGRDGSELFFRRGNEIHAVALTIDGATREARSSTRLFDAGGDIRSFDVTRDGRRFLLNVPAPSARAQPITVVVNWRSLLDPGSTEPADRRVR